MQGIILLTMVVLSSTFSLPSRKDEPQQDFEQKIISSEDFTRTQRNLVQFHNMIKCTTSRSSLYYVDYGCYCGYGGTGNPLDATDRCCQVHDECYGRIMKDPDLCTFSSSVYWKIYSRDDTCTGCVDEEGSCERAICECDGAAARCFAESEWNEEHYNYPSEHC
ncbi:basic phospholipase A2 homolog 1-like [Pocillopora damicornis]|uniref:basic phospholipase A2 homolog 1-like n=1 Tax=Pocillopora damicornis TaxID=46731 RepID=UPI000F551681|nr:basic phospholipase A2 homolog 1-like [Pocillopora damicornis]XP_058940148.1 basic phospholipase A2 homolog 1-like [Pocillopora verrucosa]